MNMTDRPILPRLLLLMILGLSSSTSVSHCSISTPLLGQWIQPGLADLITINNTWFSFKGHCLQGLGDVKNKYLFYNEQTRCKRCIFFISRHSNALQYRESECFDADDDDHARICASITPDTVLYILFRDQAESIPCPLHRIWSFEQNRQSLSPCQPKAFHPCSSSHTFQLSYNNRCPNHQDVMATCFARFTDGNINYIVTRRSNPRTFLCFSYTKSKYDAHHSSPREVYLSEDETCRDFLTREFTRTLHVLPSQRNESRVPLPDWTQGTWLSVGSEEKNVSTFQINQTQLTQIILNDGGTVKHQFQFLRTLRVKHDQHTRIIRLRAQALEQCSSILYCIKIIHRSSAVIDLSVGFDEHGCKESHLHYTLFHPGIESNISCPQLGVYKSLNTHPVSTCAVGGLRTLSVGCEQANQSELTLSSSCSHDTVPDVQVITSIRGVCLASWRTDHRFQRTLVVHEQTKAFCLIQPLKPLIASWILFESSCSHLDLSSIRMENSLRYFDQCQEQTRFLLFSSDTSSQQRLNFFLFSLLLPVSLSLSL